jgi:hypothetical protein
MKGWYQNAFHHVYRRSTIDGSRLRVTLVQQWISTDLRKLTLDSLKRAERTRQLCSPSIRPPRSGSPAGPRARESGLRP